MNSSSTVPRYTNVPTSRKSGLQLKSNIVFSEDLPVCNIHTFLTSFESQIHGLYSTYVQETLLNLLRPLRFRYTHELLFFVP